METAFAFNTVEQNHTDEISNRIVGGISVPKYLQSCKVTTDNHYKRFQNLVIPVGLTVNTIAVESHLDNDKTDSENYAVVNNEMFETLFYSVGKDLGSSRPKMNANKTKKHSKK
jgi:hypothetical protein